MARRVFFSFDYNHVWRVNQIRSMPKVIGTAAAGFQDASLWEKAKIAGDKYIKKLIDNRLKNTSVTVVCVTYGTANRKYINYEIDKSLEKGNGLLAIRIHHLKDRFGLISAQGAIPSKILENGYKAYKYSNKESLERWIEAAALQAAINQLIK